MNFRKITILLLFVATVACPIDGLAQADPFWLKSWNEAVRTRPDRIETRARIASADEPGMPLTVHGRVLRPDGQTPASGVVVHAYHRDRDGFDFGPGDRGYPTWRIQGWAITDDDGRFRFETIRPAADHMGRDGAHIHFTVESADFGSQWAPTVYFADDPLVSDREHARSVGHGEFGWMRQVRAVDGGQTVDVRIRLKPAADF